MGCQPNLLLREARKRSGLSQRRLALRAGTSQDAISRIERGVEHPTMERLDSLLGALGERLHASVAPGLDVDPAAIAAARVLSHEERLRESASWNLVVMRLEAAAKRARRST